MRFTDKGMSSTWKTVNKEIGRVQGQDVRVRVKGKSGRFRRDIEALVRIKEACQVQVAGIKQIL